MTLKITTYTFQKQKYTCKYIVHKKLVFYAKFLEISIIFSYNLELRISLEDKNPVEKKGVIAQIEEIRAEKKNSNKSSEKTKRKTFDRER